MLQIRKVNKVFNKGDVNEKVALKNLNLLLGQGEFVTVIGSNGAGKSTLLNAIAGAFPLDGGSILLGGHDITPLPAYKRSSFVGRVLQDPMKGTAPTMTVEENLSLAAKRGCSRGLKKAIDRHLLDAMREKLSYLELGLEDRLTTPAGLLSGGQRQALALFMAIFTKPRLLLLDEHTASLDPKTGRRVLELTEQLVKSQNLTTLMVTHNITDSLKLGDRTIMMHQGQIVFEVKGEERRHMTPRNILRLFEQTGGQDCITDEMLLGHHP